MTAAVKESVTAGVNPPNLGGPTLEQALPPRRTLVLIIGGLMTGLLLAGMDGTIVATAGPTVISDLGGLSVYAWVFSAYALTQTVATPIFGRLSDLYARRKLFAFGLAIFMGGSVLSGLSQGIYQLIVFRGIQGVGGGALFPVALAVVGRVFPPRLRGRAIGIVAAALTIAGVIGPTAGSYIVQVASWRWIFYVNLPIGVVSLILIGAGLKKQTSASGESKMDWRGASTLAAWVTLLMLGLFAGGTTFSWYSPEEASLFIGAAVFFALFLFLEKRARHPMLPLRLFKIRSLSSGYAVRLLTGAPFLSLIAFTPLFVQAALGGSIDDGRNVVYAFLLPSTVGLVLGGQLGSKIAYRWVVSGAVAMLSVGTFFLTSVNALTGTVVVMETIAVAAFGVGMVISSVTLAIQNSVEMKDIGIASSLSIFMAFLGGTVGITILGSIQSSAFGTQLTSLIQGVPQQFRAQATPVLSNSDLLGRVLATPQALNQVLKANPALGQFVPSLRNAFAQSFVPVFWGLFAISIVALVASLFMTGSLKQQEAAKAAASGSGQRNSKEAIGAEESG